jgi:hypothetical protein
VSVINGLVAEESRRQGYASPANSRIVEFVARIERGDLKPGPDNIALALLKP